MADGTVRCIDSEIPFAIPDSWVWCRLRDICSMQAGKNIKSTEISKVRNENYRFRCVGGNGLRGYTSKYNYEGNHAIVGRQGALCGCLNRECGKFYATEHAVVVDTFSILSDVFMYYFLTALNLNQYATATAQPGLAVSTIIEVLCPLPPLPEQHRIIATIKAIIPLISIYQDNQKRLNSLNTSISVLFKKSILQEAIQGRLVPQIASEGTAEQLLAEIAEEKKRLVKEGKLKKSALTSSRIFRGDDNRYRQNIDGEEVIIDDRLPFEIPDTWRWTTLGELILDSTGLSYKKENLADKRDPMVRVLRGGNIEEGQMMFRADDIMISAKYVPDNLYLRQGTFISPAVSSLEKIGKTALVEQDYNNVVAGGFVLLLSPLYSDNNLGKYLYYFFQTGYYHNYCRTITKKSGQAFYNLSRPKLKQCYVPIPPKEELPRILSQIDKALAGIMSR